ncbi:MAG: penicillin-binding transpeptidase domain-containing protein [Halobacteriovoraceae bacterium]|nr:penicillin-binding transpeptidase domain-containing protein [Halobacteriovoraceae bacterium]
MEKNLKNKVIFLFLIFLVGFIFILGKALKVQLFDRAALISRSKSQIFRELTVYPKRGNIYDRNGNPLAINIQTYSIFTIPKNLKSVKKSLKELSRAVPHLKLSKLLRKTKGRERYTWLARKVQLTKKQVSAVKAIKGIYIDSVPKRLYPNHEVGSQVVGFVGVDNVGLAGIEHLFNNDLKGKPKVVKYVKDAKGRPIKFESQEVGSGAKDIYLSIDKELQAAAEKYLKEAIEEHDADGGGFGVMNSKTGEILAIGNYPTFDPNIWRKGDEKSRRLSFATDPFEPGSTFKTFTVISAFENKIATPETSFFCERGRLEVEGHIISEAESKKTYEWLTVEEILKFSSNIGTTKLAFDLTFPKLKKTISKFGFGSKTGIEVPGESRGILTDKENVSPLSLSNISFGQGVATTGVQMLAAYSVIANKGLYIKPTLVKDGNAGEKPRPLIKEEVAKELERILIQAVENGTGSEAKIDMFTIAGKTSTAQRVSPTGGYRGYVGGFIGYPSNVKNPFVVYTYLDNPKGRYYYGNLVAGPVFRKITEYYLFKNKDFSNLAFEEGKDQNKFDTVNVKHSSTRIVSRTKVPNFIGLDKKSSGNIGGKLNLKIRHQGIGVVVDQFPAAGTVFENNTVVVLKYQPPSL